MFFLVLRRNWLRFLLASAVILVGTIAAYASLHNAGTGARAANALTHSFKETVGRDVYTFTDVTAESGTGASGSFGTWDVHDNGKDLGTISGTVKTSASGTNETGSLSLTGTGSLKAINGKSSTDTTFSTPANYKTSKAYLADVKSMGAANAGKVTITGPTVTGDEYIEVDCLPSSPCDQLGVTPTGVVSLGNSFNSPAAKAFTKGIDDETTGYGKLSSITATGALPALHGGGPLTVKGQQHAAIAPLVVFFIGAAIAVIGIVVANFCSHANGCAGISKNTWAIIGGMIGVVGGILMSLAFVPGLFGAAAAAATGTGEVALGAAEIAAAEAGGAAMTTAEVAAMESADVFYSAASSFSSIP